VAIFTKIGEGGGFLKEHKKKRGKTKLLQQAKRAEKISKRGRGTKGCSYGDSVYRSVGKGEFTSKSGKGKVGTETPKKRRRA